MLPSRCPHCQAELPNFGRFCVMCGRRVEGWRGLMPAGNELDSDGPASSRSPRASNEHDAPQEIGQEEQTRPVRPSANLAALAATASEEDAESRRPTGEVPSVGHELRANAPNQRVHTSPIGNVLPSEILQSLDNVMASRAGDEVTPLERPGALYTVGGLQKTGRSGVTPAPPSGQSGDRSRPVPRPASGEPTERRSGPKGRRAARLEFPVLPAMAESGAPRSTATPPAAASRLSPQRDEPRITDPNAPVAIAVEPTHFIGRRSPRPDQAVQLLRSFLWALLWLGIGGAVAFGVVVLLRRSPPGHKPVGPVLSVQQPRRPAPVATKTPPGSGVTHTAASAPVVPVVGPPRARDLVVPIPANAGRAPTGPLLPPGSAEAVPPLPAPVVASPDPALPLDPQQQAAFDQTMSNIEFVVSERIAQVRACYDRAVRSAGPEAPSGHVEVSLTLSDEGQAAGITTVENTVGSVQLAGCLEQRIAEWRFPRPLGSVRTFRLPFTFSPSPQQSGPRPRFISPNRR